MVHLIKIENLPATVRLRNVCLKAGIETIGDVLAMTMEEILCVRNFGTTTLLEMHCILSDYSFRFLDNETLQTFWGFGSINPLEIEL